MPGSVRPTKFLTSQHSRPQVQVPLCKQNCNSSVHDRMHQPLPRVGGSHIKWNGKEGFTECQVHPKLTEHRRRRKRCWNFRNDRFYHHVEWKLPFPLFQSAHGARGADRVGAEQDADNADAVNGGVTWRDGESSYFAGSAHIGRTIC